MKLSALLALAALSLAGCASQPVVLSMEKGTIVIPELGTVSGDKVRYSRGVLLPGEAAATWSGDVSIGANTAPAPKPPAPPPPAPAPAPAPEPPPPAPPAPTGG